MKNILQVITRLTVDIREGTSDWPTGEKAARILQAVRAELEPPRDGTVHAGVALIEQSLAGTMHDEKHLANWDPLGHNKSREIPSDNLARGPLRAVPFGSGRGGRPVEVRGRRLRDHPVVLLLRVPPGLAGCVVPDRLWLRPRGARGRYRIPDRGAARLGS